jgi:hypothetical protein
MRIMQARLRSKPGSKLYYGRPIEEGGDWMERAFIDSSDLLYLPAHAIKRCLDSSILFASKHSLLKGVDVDALRHQFYTGILISDAPRLTTATGQHPLRRSDLLPVSHTVPRNGWGDSEKVTKIFPTVDSWATCITMCLLLDDIDVSQAKSVVEWAGSYIGFGAMRLENGGCNGAFDLLELVEASEPCQTTS